MSVSFLKTEIPPPLSPPTPTHPPTAVNSLPNFTWSPQNLFAKAKFCQSKNDERRKDSASVKVVSFLLLFFAVTLGPKTTLTLPSS